MHRAAMKIVASLLLAVLLSGCIVAIDTDHLGRSIRGSGVRETVDRSSDPFDNVWFATEGTLQVEIGSTEAIRIEADSNLLRHIDTVVRGGTLFIEVEDGVDLDPRTPIRVYVTARHLYGISIAGSGDAEIGTVSAEAFSVAILGSGNVRIDELHSSSTEVSIAGSGNLDVAGSTSALQLSLAGSGNLHGHDFSSEDASISVMGSGSATVRVTEHLSVTIAGSGNVRYYGQPSVHSSILGTGKVSRVD